MPQVVEAEIIAPSGLACPLQVFWKAPPRPFAHHSRSSGARCGSGGPGTVYAWAPGTVSSDPYGQPTQTPKKRRTWLIVLLIIAGVLVGPASCAVLVGTAGMAITEDTTPRVESPASAPSVKDPYAELRKEPGFISRDDLGDNGR